MPGTVRALEIATGPSNENIFALGAAQYVNNYILTLNTIKSIPAINFKNKIIIISAPSSVDIWYAWKSVQPTWPVAADIVNGDGWFSNPGPLYFKDLNFQSNLYLVSTVTVIIGIAVYSRSYDSSGN